MDKDLERKAAQANKFMMEDAPRIVGVEGVNFIKDSFQKEGFEGKPWKNVKRRTNPRKSQEGKASSKRKILTGETGDLGDSIDYNADYNGVAFTTDVEYAQAHNEGTTTAGKGNKTTIPKRQFMPIPGQPLPEALERDIKAKFDKRLNQIFNSK